MRFVLSALSATVLLAGCGRFTSVDTYLRRADEAVAQGDHRAAMVELLNALRKDATRDDVRLRLAESVLWLGDPPAAERELAKVGAGVDGARRAQLEVRVDLARGRSEQALKRLRDPESKIPVAHREWLLGSAYMTARQPVEARQHFDAAVAADATLVEAAAGSFEAQAAMGDRAGALEGLAALTSSHEDSAQAWLTYGLLLAGGGDYQGTLHALQRAQALAPRQLEVPKQVSLLAALVEAQLLSGDLTAARESGATLSRLVPRTPLAAFMDSRIAFASGDYAAAVSQLRNVTNSTPQFLQARFLLAMALVAQGNLGQASAELNSLVEQAPEFPAARQMLAQVRMRLDDPDGALRMLVPVLESGSQDPEVGALIAAARSRLGAEQSVKLLEEMLAKEPANAALRAQLASAYLQANRPEMAAKLLESGDGGDNLQGAALLVRALAESGSPAAARAKVDSMLAAKPGDAMVASLAAAHYASTGDLNAGRSVLERALQQGADPGAVLLSLAQLEWSTGARGAAAATLDRLLALQPKNAVALMSAGEIALVAGKLPEARKYFEGVIAARPQVIEPRMRLVQIALLQNDAKLADTLEADILKLSTQQAAVRDALGTLYLNAGRADHALRLFRAAVDLDQKEPAYWLNLGRAQRVMGQAGAARESLQKALTLRPDWLPATAVLALVDIEAGDPDAAFARVAALRKKAPRDVNACVLEGDVYAAAQRNDKASDTFSEAFALQPSLAVATKSYQVRLAGKLAKPTELLEKWTAGNPQDLKARLLLASNAARDGNRALAIDQYRAVLEAQPGNVVVLNNLAWLYFEARDPRAIPTAREAVRLGPQIAAVNDTLGWLLVNAGKTEEGLKFLSTAVAQPGADGEIRYHHAAALARSGAATEAEKRLDALLEESGEFPSRDEAQKLLADLSARPRSGT